MRACGVDTAPCFGTLVLTWSWPATPAGGPLPALRACVVGPSSAPLGPFFLLSLDHDHSTACDCTSVARRSHCRHHALAHCARPVLAPSFLPILITQRHIGASVHDIVSCTLLASPSSTSHPRSLRTLCRMPSKAPLVAQARMPLDQPRAHKGHHIA